jgi:hypothetical protein
MKSKFILFFFILFSINVFSQSILFDKIKEMSDSVSLQNITNHIKVLEEAGGHFSRVTFTEGIDSAVNYIQNEFNKYSNLTLEIDTFYIESAIAPYNLKPQFNIAAAIKGADTTGYYVIGAHYDCSASRMGSSTWTANWKTLKAPGADDNATGIALLFELARILSDTSFGFMPSHSIKLIALAAEESHPAYSGNHHGSLHDAKKSKENGDNILGMVSADMFGYNYNHDYLSIVADQNSAVFGQKFLDTNTLFNIDLIVHAALNANARYSDHASYWDEGYKAILLIENAPPWNNSSYYDANPLYHTSYDSSGSLNYGLVKKITQLTLTSIASLASNLVVNIHDEEKMPISFKLFQNYPNPFNPTTSIKYSVSSLQFTIIKVYDMLGNEVATLVNEQKSPGEYEVKFDGSNLSSGIYFYQIKCGSFIQTNKMLLMK